MYKFFTIILIFCFVLTMWKISTEEKDTHFWYPVEKLNAKCTTWNGNVFKMKNSRGWRSWPYYLNIDTKTEITLPNDCTLISLKVYPKLEEFKSIREQLTDYRKKYIIEGF